ncbi:MAG: hypothetical protein ACRDM7_17345 [Thermoleophilaceae bacterium]
MALPRRVLNPGWDGLQRAIAGEVVLPVDPAEPPAVNVFGAMLAGESDTAELLDDLVARAGAVPTSASTGHANYRDTKRHLAERGGEDDGGHPYT